MSTASSVSVPELQCLLALARTEISDGNRVDALIHDGIAWEQLTQLMGEYDVVLFAPMYFLLRPLRRLVDAAGGDTRSFQSATALKNAPAGTNETEPLAH